MKVLENGVMRTLTDEEEKAFRLQSSLEIARQKRQPLTDREVYSLIIEQQVNNLDVDDNTALRMVGFYPEWKTNTTYSVGFKVQRNGNLWRVVQAHTSQEGWQPENTPSLWEQVNETHTGELTDPIPYNGNMALENGKHYIQDDDIYLCNRNTEIPVYNTLSELEGLYVMKM